MASGDDAARIYADFSGFARMRADARSGAAGSTEAVARQFESIFVQMMLQSMRDATLDSGLFGGAMRTYQDMFDRQIGLELTAERGIGLADMLIRQLEGPAPGSARPFAPAPPVTGSRGPATSPGIEPGPLPDAVPGAARDAVRDAVRGAALEARATASVSEASRRSAFDSPQDFVDRLLPHARQAGADLGVDPKVLLAQAALETGWGRHVMADREGRSANNFFGIKADRRWDGPRVQVSTLESLGGVLERIRADFRAYASPAEGFRDYVEFISGQGRYADALDVAADPAAYLHGLQAAGYATDPAYAEKILGILRRGDFAAMVRAREAAQVARAGAGAALMREVF